MGKFSIISRHIVLTGNQQFHPKLPVYGIILIDEEVIEDVILIQEDVPSKTVAEKYADWNPLDYSDYYVSPGIIDLNVTRTWESYSDLTKAAVSGGTCFLLQDSLKTQNSDQLFCDVANVPIISDENACDIDELLKGAFAVKGYNFPPSGDYKPLINQIEFVMQKLLSRDIPLLFDPTAPNQRMILQASPFRTETLDSRINKKPSRNSQTNTFAGAFPDPIDSGVDDSPKENYGTVSSPFGCCIQAPKVKDPSSALLVSNTLRPPQRRKTYTIFDDLNRRIRENQDNIQNLSRAEVHTYNASGTTSFDAKKSNFSQRLKRPPPLSIKKAETNKEKLYIYYLANFPYTWEVSGVDKILQSMHPESKIHIVNLSSAAALNRVRQAKQNFKNLTSEVGSSHLYFTSDSVKEGDTRFKSHPPIRNTANCNLLWELLKFKGIDSISSQHHYVPSEYKTDNFQTALKGISSIEFTMQVPWTILNIPVKTSANFEHYLIRLSKWLSLQPANTLGLKNRGSIEKGKLADLVVWDPYEKVSDAMSFYGNSNPFVSQQLLGSIHKVFVRGKLAFEEGVFKPFGRVFK